MTALFKRNKDGDRRGCKLFSRRRKHFITSCYLILNSEQLAAEKKVALLKEELCSLGER